MSNATSTHEETMLEGVLRGLNESRGQWAEVSSESGVPYHTLTKIAQRRTPNPRFDTVSRLHAYFSCRSMNAKGG